MRTLLEREDNINHNDLIKGVRIIQAICNREALAIEIDTSLSSKRVIRVLNKVIEQRGKPKVIRVDNGPEFTSKDLELWANKKLPTHCLGNYSRIKGSLD